MPAFKIAATWSVPICQVGDIEGKLDVDHCALRYLANEPMTWDLHRQLTEVVLGYNIGRCD